MEYITVVTGSLEENCHVIYKNNRCVIADPGDNPEKILEEINRLNLIPEGIILTHTHFDHIGGIGGILDKYDIPVYVSEIDFKRIAINDNSSVYYMKYEIPQERVIFVSDGYEIKLSEFKVKVMSTPGHSKGSLCYFVDNLMITGDTLFYQSIGRYDLEGGSFEEIKRTFKDKIMKIKENYILLCGHGENSTLKYELSNNPYIRYFVSN
jgi:glyoxylase-like metal-dependent hydrolase (beta-lactamase superfamily II)